LLSGSLGTGAGSTTPIASSPTSTTFPETTFAVGNNPVALAAASYSGGTLPDMAVVNQNSNSISILLNQDNGIFATQASSPFVLAKNETGPVSIASGTFGNTATNSSGITVAPVDLVIANSTSNNVTVLLGNGDGTFVEAAGSPYAVGNDPSSIVVADFNGDGIPDFAVANKGDNTISFFKGNGDGTFTQFPTSPFKLQNSSTIAEKGPVAMVTANLRNATLSNTSTNAPEADLAIVNELTNNVTLLLGSIDSNGNALFTEPVNSPLAVGSTPVAIATADVNVDGVPDLAIVNQADNTVTVLLGSTNLDATFTAASGSPLPTGSSPAGIAIANFTGTFPSIAVTNLGASTLGVYVGLGGGTFSNRLEIPTPVSPSAIIADTLTSSGLPDVALTALGTTPGQGLLTIIQDSSSFATGTTPTQTPYPGSEYIDLGVKVKATPTLHPNREVTLELEFEISALSGDSVNGIPIITSHTMHQTIRVREDETSIIEGLLNKQETRAITGLPGFANIPVAGYLFGSRNNTTSDTEILILVTPRRLRSPLRQAPSIYAGRGDATSRGSIGAGAPQPPVQVPTPPPATPAPAPDQQPPAPAPNPNPNEPPANPPTNPPANRPPANPPPATQPP
jgi:Bacterial type II and III secretion system protein/FG-GAP-like repeat